MKTIPQRAPSQQAADTLGVALLTRQQAADTLGICVRTIDSLLASGELPCVPIGRSVRIRPSALEELIESLETRRNPNR